MPRTPAPILFLVLCAAACSGAGGRQSSPLFWQSVKTSVSPSRTWAGSPLFVHAFLERENTPEKPPVAPLVVLDSIGGKRRVRLRPRSADIIATAGGVDFTFGLLIPSRVPAGTYYCRLISRQGVSLATAGQVILDEVPDRRDGGVAITFSRAGTLTIENSHYVAVVDLRSGMLRRVSDDPGKPALLANEQLTVRDPDGEAARPRGAAWWIEEQAPFYARLVSQHDLGNGLLLERILEVGDSPHIHSTCVLRSRREAPGATITWSLEVPAGSEISAPPEGGHPLLAQDRRIETPEGRTVLLGKTTDDLWVREPSQPLGGLDDGLPGIRSVGTIKTADWRIQETVMSSGTVWDVDDAGTPRPVGLAPGIILVFGRVITVAGADVDSHNYFHQGSYRLLDRNPFYPRLGRLSRAVTSPRGWTFANWNNFQYAAELAPIHRKPIGMRSLLRDQLLSMGSYLTERMRRDGGWPRWFAWTVYPEGARFSAHARALPFLVYLWGLLHKQEGRRGLFVQRLYETLQTTQELFDPTSDSNFTDRTEDGVPYIAYSDTYKQADLEGVREVANTHAHAYRFAHLMAEMSTLAGDDQAAAAWNDVLKWGDRGSARLFADLYPARDPATGREVHGLIAYSLHSPEVVKLPYNGISMMGLADSLSHAGLRPLELVEVVERTTTDYRADTSDGAPDPAPEQPFLARLYRTQPLSLAVAHDAEQVGPLMADRIELASLGEVLSAQSGAAVHDTNLAILIDDGKTVALTDNPFLCEWTPGYFEEVPIDRLDPAQRFNVSIGEQDGLAPHDHWAATRNGDTIELMASAATTLQVTLIVPPGASVWRRVDRYTAHAWETGKKELAGRNTGSDSREMTFPVALAAKDRGTLEITP